MTNEESVKEEAEAARFGEEWNTRDSAIQAALNDRWEWLEHQATGSAASRRAAWRDLGDAGLAEDRVRQNYTGRYTIELLQNAHDACADARVVGGVWFEVRPSALLVANQGVPFSADRIVSLARLGSSEKARRKVRGRLIGYKGIGFTSVFEISDRPQVISKNVSFCFDREEALRRVAAALGGRSVDEPVPARYFPLPLHHAAWKEDADAVERLLAAGATTVIRLPLRPDRSPDRVVDDLRNTINPEFLLFGPAVSRVEVRAPGWRSGWRRVAGRRFSKGTLQHLIAADGERRSWLVRSSFATVTEDEVSALRDELWKNVRRLNVAIALPWKSSGLDREPPAQPVFAYFPTADRMGRGVLVHGDFYLDEARRRIASSGPQGIISNRVCDEAARLTAELAASLTDEGNRLLGCLAPVDRPDGYGQVLSEKLDAALKKAPIVRPASGGRPKPTAELKRLPGKMALARERVLLAMLNKRSDLVYPGDDRGRAADLLKLLGCDLLPSSEVASRVEPSRTKVQYSTALRLLEAWLKSIEAESFGAVMALRRRAVVQDMSGKWLTSSEVLRRDPATPSLPSFLERPEVAIPVMPAARAFIARFAIGTLSPAAALEELIDAVVANLSSMSDEEKAEALSFAWRLWRADSSIFEDKYNIGALPVPVRPQGKRAARGWERADRVYFSGGWTKDRVLESLYGPFGLNEFLAEDPSEDASEARQRSAFYKAIGVANYPRWVALGWKLPNYYAWWSSPEVSNARHCPDGHPNTERRAEGRAIDRLDELLVRVERDPVFGKVLARGLLLFKEPYGPDARIRCTHSAHRQHSSGGNAAPGYQRWRLQSTSWIPTSQHPAGASIARPSEVWFKIPRSGDRLVVARAALSSDDSKRLELVDADAPHRDAVERALELLYASNKDLRGAGNEIRETAEWLIRRLDRSIHGKVIAAKAPPLPGITSGGYVWSHEPAIVDLPGMPLFQDLAVLPPGRWTGLKRAYGLRHASTLVSDEVQVGRRMRIPPLLPEAQRAELLALLMRVGAPEAGIARRLALLREQAAADLAVKWRTRGGEEHVVENCGFHLALKRDGASRVTHATLYQAGDLAIDNVSLGRVLASYLDVPDFEHTVALYLNSRELLVEQQGLVQDEIAEAAELLRRKGLPEEHAASPVSEELPLSEQSHDEEDEEQPAGKDTTGATESQPSVLADDKRPEPRPIVDGDTARLEDESHDEPDRAAIDPATVIFGPARQPSPVVPRAIREAGQPRAPGSRSSNSHHEPQGSLAPNPTVEDLAMKVVERYGLVVLTAKEVRDVHTLNLGWDLEFHYADGRWEPIEVKGSAGIGAFIITRNEWKAAREHASYVLFHVTNLSNPSLASMRVYRRLGERLTDAHLTPLSWTVSNWIELEPEEVPIKTA